MEAETGRSWIPGLALLARNDGHVVVIMPAFLMQPPLRYGVFHYRLTLA